MKGYFEKRHASGKVCCLEQMTPAMPTIYFDAIINTQLSEGVVRIGIADYVGPPIDGKRQTGEMTHLATSLLGLVQLQAQVNKLVENLIEKGILKRQTPAQIDEDKPIA